MSVENFLNSLQNTEVGDFSFLDFDTIKQGDKSMRILGIDAPEVQNWTEDGVTMADPYGATLSGLAANLAKQSGMTNIIESGEKDDYGRKLIRLQNDDGVDFTDKAYLEGVLRPRTFTGEREQQLFKQGEYNRAINQQRGIQEDPNDLWAAARKTRLDSQTDNTDLINRLGISPLKLQAFDQKQYKSFEDRYGGFNFYKPTNFEYPIKGANYDGTATSTLKTSWKQAVTSMKSGYQGMIAAFNDLTNDETNWNYRTSKAKEHDRRVANLPTYVTSVSDVESWKDFGDYTVGLMGGVAPYLVGIAGGAAIASLTAPAWMPAAAVAALGALPMALIYSGQTYNEMEGEGMDDMNASLAFTAGTIMATLDRLGLAGIMKASQTLRKDSHEVIIEAVMKKDRADVAAHNAKNKGVFERKKHMTYEEANGYVQAAFLLSSKELVQGLVGMVDLPITKELIIRQGGGDLFQGAIREGVTELAQEATQYGASVLGSEREWSNTEAADRALNALIGGSLMGGILSPALATPSAIQERRRLSSMFRVAKEQPNMVESEFENIDILNAAEMESQGTVDKDGNTTRAAVTEDEIENVTNDYQQWRDKDNLLANKGIWQWIKDIPKNFISRPLNWYWNSEMREKLGFNAKAEALISLFAQTNKDKVSGELASDIENRLYSKLSNMLVDTIAIARGYLGETTGAKGRTKMQTVFANLYKAHKLQQKTDKLTEEEQALVDLINKTLSEEQQTELRNRIDSMARQLNEEVRILTGKELNLTGEKYLKNVRPDKTKIKGKESEVKQRLKDNGFTEKEADEIIFDILEAPDGTSTTDAAMRLSIEDVYPGTIGDRIDYNPFNEEGMEAYGQEDLLAGMESTAREIIHAAVVTKVVGPEGRTIKKTLAQIKREAGDAWDPKFAADIISAAEIWMGIYKPIQNKRLKELQANVTAFNLTTLLGTAGPAQMPELWAAFLGRISAGQGGRPLVQDLRKIAGVMAKHYMVSGEQILAKFSKKTGLSLTDSWTPNRLRMGAGGFLGIKYGAIGQLGVNAEEVKSNKIRSAISQAFITISGIKPLTDISRMGADFIGNDAIMHYMDVLDTFYNPDIPMTVQVKEAYDMIQETRVPPMRFLKLWREMKEGANKKFRDVDWTQPDNFPALEAYMKENHSELTRYMDISRKSWVDNSLANPGASSKSRVSNDPHLALLFQFRGYILTFAASIVPRLMKRAVSGNPNQDVNAIATMAGLVAMGFLAQALKDEWKTEGRPYWLDDAEYFQRGVQASGMLGPFDFLLDAVNPIYGETSVFSLAEGVAGPTWGNIKQFSKVGKNTIAGESDAAIEAALKFVPVYGHKDRFRKDPIGTISGGILGD